jgi:hypothetical protein
MKTRLLFSSIALSLLLAACMAPLPAPPPRAILPDGEKPQLPLAQNPEADKMQIELPAAPAPQADQITIQRPALPPDELRDFGQIRGAEEQRYSQPLPRPALPPDELRDFGQIRAAEEQKYSQPLPRPALPPDELRDFGQIRGEQERKTYPVIVVTPQAGVQDRYTAMKQLYEAGYQPPNALLAPHQLLDSAMYRYPILRRMHNLPPLDGSGQSDRYTAMKQLYEAGYQPPNALLNAQAYRYTAMKQFYDAGYRPPNALLDNTR